MIDSFSGNLWKKLTRSKAYREGFVASIAKRMLPLQIRVLRKQRDWSQARLAKESKLTQGVISRAEDPEYGNLTINTLVRIGAGFDCAFVARFVPFRELIDWYGNVTDEKKLEAPTFNEELAHYVADVLTDHGSTSRSPVSLSSKDTITDFRYQVSDMVSWRDSPGGQVASKIPVARASTLETRRYA